MTSLCVVPVDAVIYFSGEGVDTAGKPNSSQQEITLNSDCGLRQETHLIYRGTPSQYRIAPQSVEHEAVPGY